MIVTSHDGYPGPRPPPSGRFLLVDPRTIIPEDEESPECEARACRLFFYNQTDDGQVPAREPYASTRDEAFIKTWYVGATISQIMKDKRPWSCLEDAREAIYVGQRAGYSDADIAAYLLRNYVF